MKREALLDIWRAAGIPDRVKSWATKERRLAPVELETDAEPAAALLDALRTIGVMELRTNDKVNVPDIFRLKAGIRRKGGVAVPRGGRRRA